MTDQIVYKHADIDETFFLDWEKIIVQPWRPDHYFSANQIARPPVADGFYYQATTAGRSGQLVPDFVGVASETTEDGSVIWTAQHPSSPTFVTIDDHVWALDSGISEADKTIDGFRTFITVTGGVAGEQYRMDCVITKSDGEEEKGSLVLEILDPAEV